MDCSIIKVVYFDEGSATDYIQISIGGKLTSVETLLDENSESGSLDASAKVGIGSRALHALLGFEASAKVEGDLGTSFNTGTVAKSIISNTVLTDFLSYAEEDESNGKNSESRTIIIFRGIRIERIPGTISAISLLSPYFSMFRSGQGIQAGDLDISIDKLDSTFSKAKGYLEFRGIVDNGDDIIVRFNRSALKNNYRPSDLLKMDLTLYAVKVGSCTAEDLLVDNELNTEDYVTTDNPDYTEEPTEHAFASKELDMYDVILAGVSARG